MLFAGRKHPIDGRLQVRVIHLGGLAQRHGQIVGAHKNAVHALHGGDLLDMLQSAQGLTLGNEHGFPVAVGKIARRVRALRVKAVAAGEGGRKAPAAQGVVLGVLHQAPHLVHRLHVGHHQSTGTHVQHLQNRRTGHILHPHQGRAVPGGQGRDSRQGALYIGGAVLRVHDGKVHAGDADALGRSDAAQLIKGAQGVSALQKLFPQQIVHAFASSLFPSRTWLPAQIR